MDCAYARHSEFVPNQTGRFLLCRVRWIPEEPDISVQRRPIQQPARELRTILPGQNYFNADFVMRRGREVKTSFTTCLFSTKNIFLLIENIVLYKDRIVYAGLSDQSLNTKRWHFTANHRYGWNGVLNRSKVRRYCAKKKPEVFPGLVFSQFQSVPEDIMRSTTWYFVMPRLARVHLRPPSY